MEQIVLCFGNSYLNWRRNTSFCKKDWKNWNKQHLQLVRVKNLGEEACEIVESTKTKDHVDILLQVEQLKSQHQIEEVSAVENSSQVQLQQVSEIKMIADAV